jgi:hypothetical protein
VLNHVKKQWVTLWWMLNHDTMTLDEILDGSECWEQNLGGPHHTPMMKWGVPVYDRGCLYLEHWMNFHGMTHGKVTHGTLNL